MKVHVLSKIIRDDKLGTLTRGAVVDLPDHKAEFLRRKGEVEYYQTKVIREQPMVGRWDRVVCLASGPSLTPEDVELVRQWRIADAPPGERRGVIAVNTTFRLAPWADALFAMDRTWWNQYVDEVNETFLGQRFSNNGHIARMKTTHVKITSYGNSGAAAVSLAASANAKQIILLGYDCKYSDTGARHWHGDHPRGLGNAARIDQWAVKFERLAKEQGVGREIVNASRDTALTCFPRVRLEDVLK